LQIKIRNGVAKKYSTEYAEKLSKLEGKWVEVNITHLFPDQFNIHPVENVSDMGIRIYAVDVEEIKDDERLGRSRCTYCGRWEDTGKPCKNCSKGTEYMEEFFPGSSKNSGMVDEINKIFDGIIK